MGSERLSSRHDSPAGCAEEQMHDDDVVVSDALARALIDSQFPDYAGLALSRVPAVGTVNVIYRLGADLSARFPRRTGDANATRAALEREADCAAWSLQTWLPGSTASPSAVADSAESQATLPPSSRRFGRHR
jgi:hypothetical protein